MHLLVPTLILACSPDKPAPEATGPTFPHTGYEGDGGGDLPTTGDGGEAGWSWGSTATIEEADTRVSNPADQYRSMLTLEVPGDTDGDGRDDLAIGVPYAAGNLGRVYLVAGQRWSAGIELDGLPGIDGEFEDGELGGVVTIGDVNGDGLADLGMTHGSSGEGLNLPAMVLYGRSEPLSASILASESDVILLPGDGLSNNLRSGPGDLDGDGFDDLIVVNAGLDQGTWWFVGGGGALGGEDMLSTFAEADIRGSLGWGELTLRGSTDVDGDSYADLLFERSPGPKATHGLLIRGGPSFVDGPFALSERMTVFSSGGPAHFSSNTPWPDIDGDGLGEISLRLSGDPDQTVVCLGREAWPEELSAVDCELQLFSGTDWRPSPSGDLDGDGHRELLASLSTDEEEALAIVPGRASWPSSVGIEELATRIEAAEGGLELPGVPGLDEVGDFDGDGREDLIFTSPGATVAGLDEAGFVGVLLGRSEWPEAMTVEDLDLRILGDFEGQRLGDQVVRGDFDGDGRTDLAMVSRYVVEPDWRAAVYVFFGQPR